jgi:hypothetical protein
MMRTWIAVKIGRLKAWYWSRRLALAAYFLGPLYRELVHEMCEFLDGDLTRPMTFFKYWHSEAKALIAKERRW